MKLSAPWRTLSGKIVLAALAVEVLMLSLLIGNSLSLLYSTFTEEAKRHAEQLVPILETALVAPLAQRDWATVHAILVESEHLDAIGYIAVVDMAGSTVASRGWPSDQDLPAADLEITLTPKAAGPRYDVVAPLGYAGQQLGTLHLGLDLSPIVVARRTLLTQGGFIALGGVLLSALLLLSRPT